MAQLMDDEESSISIMLLRSAMPDWKLHKRISFLERKIKQLSITRYNNCWTSMEQKPRHSQSMLVPEIMKFIKPIFVR